MKTTKAVLAHVLIFTTLSVLAGCGSQSPYLKASGDFATAVDNSMSTLRGMKDLNSRLCQQRARLDYLFHRLEQRKLPESDKPVYWAAYPTKFDYQVPQSDGTFKNQSWKTHCTQIQTADAIVDKALVGLSAYASALKKISTEDFSGADVQSLANDANTLAGKIIAPSRATDIAKTLPNPLGQLAGALLKNYAGHKVAEVVGTADPDVTKILDGVGEYIDALLSEEKDAAGQMSEVLNAADEGLPKNSMEILRFSNLSSRWTDDLQAKMDAQQTLATVLKKLQAAEAALATAGKQEKPDAAAELKTVLGNASVVIGDIEALNKAIQGKGGSNK